MRLATKKNVRRKRRKRYSREKEEILVEVQELAAAIMAGAERELGTWGNIATKAQVSRLTVWRIAKGITRNPYSSTLLGLARAAGVELRLAKNGRMMIRV